MTDAPKRIAFRKKYMNDAITNGPLMDDPNYIHYIRADLSADLVRAGYLAGLEATAKMISEYTTAKHVARDIRVGVFPEQSPKREAMADDTRALSADPEAIAAIVARVTEGK